MAIRDRGAMTQSYLFWNFAGRFATKAAMPSF
jgi:hypothetical protein